MCRSLARAALMLGLAALCLPTPAGATPTVAFKATVIPIKGFPGTGYKLGAGAALRAQLTISGTESIGGVPSQLRKVVTYLPKGTNLNPSPFTTCAPAKLEYYGPAGCPKASIASPVGIAGVVDPIGGELITEQATLQAFFAPGGALSFYSNATSPISAQVVAQGHFLPASGPFETKLVTEVPLIESVPGAPAVSVTSVDVRVGAATRRGKKAVYYGLVPRSCPRGGFYEKAELTFENGETVTATGRLPCPKR